jgi:hypothetical protein
MEVISFIRTIGITVSPPRVCPRLFFLQVARWVQVLPQVLLQGLVAALFQVSLVLALEPLLQVRISFLFPRQ